MAKKTTAVAVSIILVLGFTPVQGFAETTKTLLSTNASTTALATPAEGSSFSVTITVPLVQAGDYTGEDESKSVQKAASYSISAANKSAIKSRLIAALAKPTANGTGIQVDLKDLAIPTALSNNTLDSKTTTAQLSPIFQEAVNENPDFFYISNQLTIGYFYSSGKWLISYLQTYYSVSAASITSMRTSYTTAINNAIKWIPANGTDYQKAKAAHDWLVRNCGYNTKVQARLNAGDSNPSNWYKTTYGNMNPWSAYGALVEKTPVCEGYSLAFIAMMSRANIDADFVKSGDESHGWNRAKLANMWYHLDITWDDPLVNGKDQGSSATPSTTWFAKSDSYMRSKGGVHSSWTPATPACNDPAYNNYSSWPTYKANAANPISSSTGSGSNTNTSAISLTNATLTLSDSTVTYTGTAQTPTVTVKSGNTTLKAGTDYTVAYRNNTAVGTATVTVTGKGNYRDTKSITFKIATQSGIQLNARTTTVTMDGATSKRYTYDGRDHVPAIVVKLKSTGATLTQGTDYTVTYPSDKKSPGTKTITIKGVGIYLDGLSFTVTYTIAGSISQTTMSSVAAVTYNGKAQKKAPILKSGSITLKEGTDYTISYPSDCTSAGTKNCTIVGKGAFSGARTYSYVILKAAASSTSISVPSYAKYTGKAVTPAVTVKLGGTTLKQGTDYTLSYKNNVSKSTKASVTITGKGSLTGAMTKYFTINDTGTAVTRKAVYRIYMPATGKHHYTTDANEKKVLVSKHGWKDEGIAWYAPSTSTEPVYRVYNARSGEHHYTRDINEKNVLVSKFGWKYEGIAWYSDTNKGVKLERVYNPRVAPVASHHYSADANEIKTLRSKYGWKYEGIAWYGMK